MRGGAAHIKAVNRSAIVGPAGNGTKEEKLLERKLALKNVALGEAEFALEVEWRDDLAADDDFFDVGSVFGEGVDDSVAEGFALVVPRAVGEFVGSVLDEAGKDVLAGRGNGRIGEAGNDDVDIRFAGEAAVLGVVVGALHVLDAGGDGNCAAKMRALAGHGLEIGERVEREIDFAGGAAEFVAANTFEEIGGEFAGLKKFFESEMRVDAGGDDAGGNFFAGLEGYAGGAAIFYEDSFH